MSRKIEVKCDRCGKKSTLMISRYHRQGLTFGRRVLRGAIQLID